MTNFEKDSSVFLRLFTYFFPSFIFFNEKETLRLKIRFWTENDDGKMEYSEKKYLAEV